MVQGVNHSGCIAAPSRSLLLAGGRILHLLWLVTIYICQRITLGSVSHLAQWSTLPSHKYKKSAPFNSRWDYMVWFLCQNFSMGSSWSNCQLRLLSFIALLTLSFFTSLSRVCVCVCVCVHAQSCVTLCDLSPLGSSVHGISQARILEWVSITFSRGSADSRIKSSSPALAGGFFTSWATREALSLRAPYKKSAVCIWIYINI